MNVVISEFMDPAAVAHLSASHRTFYDAELVSRAEELIERLAIADALVVRNRSRVTEALLQNAPSLKVVGRLGVGLDNIDVDACRRRSIDVVAATGANARSVAEYVIGAAMMLLRGAYFASAAVANGEWPRDKLGKGRELAGTTMGIIGFGSIGRYTARLGRAVGMQVLAFDTAIPSSSTLWADENVDYRMVDALLAEADVVSLHVPLIAETRHLIDAKRLAQMKSDAILINTARGGVVDENALAEALVSGRIGGAALDVFETEPLSIGSPLASCPNLLLTPHIAGVTADSNVRVSMMIAEKVDAALRLRTAAR